MIGISITIERFDNGWDWTASADRISWMGHSPSKATALRAAFSALHMHFDEVEAVPTIPLVETIGESNG